MKRRSDKFNLSKYPELRHFNQDELEPALRKANQEVFSLRGSYSGWYGLAIVLGGIAAPALVHPTLVYLFSRAFPSHSMPRPVSIGVSMSVSIGCAAWIALTVLSGKIRKSLRRQLLEAGVPICLKCGYDIRGLSTPRCPECGGEFDPALLERDDASGDTRAQS